MFFGKTKKKNKPTTIEHPVLGTLIKKTDWYTKKSFIITLWDKTFDLYLCIYSNQKDAVISFEQEEAIRYYLDNQIQIERDIQKMLLNFFHTSDCSLIEKSIQIEGLNFTRNGAISIGLISDFSDEFLEKHIGEDVIFTDSFGMSVYPIKAVLPNEKVYYNFNNKYEALSWICKNQLGRRNLTPQQKKYLIGERYDAEKKAHGGDRKSGQVKSTVQNEPLISSHMTRAQIAEDTKTSESYVMRADLYAKGVNAAEEVLPGIKNDLLSGKYKPRETDVAAVARASPEERREKAEQLRVIPEKKSKADKESARSGTKRQQEVYATIDKSYEDMKDSKRVTEDSALVSLRYTARNMVETCDVLFTNFPGLLEKPDYKDQVIEIMQEPKQYILKLEGETDNEQH